MPIISVEIMKIFEERETRKKEHHHQQKQVEF